MPAKVTGLLAVAVLLGVVYLAEAKSPPYKLDVGTMAPGDTVATEWVDVSRCEGVSLLADGSGSDSMQISIQYAIMPDGGGDLYMWTHLDMTPPDSVIVGGVNTYTRWISGRDRFQVDWERSSASQLDPDGYLRRMILRNISAVDTCRNVVIAQICADGF